MNYDSAPESTGCPSMRCQVMGGGALAHAQSPNSNKQPATRMKKSLGGNKDFTFGWRAA
jgi:hypothetical protein